MSCFVIDVETDGPIPGSYSMISFGCIICRNDLTNPADKFLGFCRPISNKWKPEALAISGYSRNECLTFPDPIETMHTFRNWINSRTVNRPIFYADNNGFDWSFMNHYFHEFCGDNPFGYSSRNINDIWKGMQNDMTKSFKHLRKTRHDHNPVNDATGNAEALIEMKNLGLQIKFE